MPRKPCSPEDFDFSTLVKKENANVSSLTSTTVDQPLNKPESSCSSTGSEWISLMAYLQSSNSQLMPETSNNSLKTSRPSATEATCAMTKQENLIWHNPIPMEGISNGAGKFPDNLEKKSPSTRYIVHGHNADPSSGASLAFSNSGEANQTPNMNFYKPGPLSNLLSGSTNPNKNAAIPSPSEQAMGNQSIGFTATNSRFVNQISESQIPVRAPSTLVTEAGNNTVEEKRKLALHIKEEVASSYCDEYLDNQRRVDDTQCTKQFNVVKKEPRIQNIKTVDGEIAREITPNPMTCHQLSEHVKAKRRRTGKPEITPSDLEVKAVKHQMSPEEYEKALRRKLQNKQAAERCRLKKRAAAEEMEKKLTEALAENEAQREEIKRLNMTIKNLEGVLLDHLKSGQCSLNTPVPEIHLANLNPRHLSVSTPVIPAADALCTNLASNPGTHENRDPIVVSASSSYLMNDAMDFLKSEGFFEDGREVEILPNQNMVMVPPNTAATATRAKEDLPCGAASLPISDASTTVVPPKTGQGLYYPGISLQKSNLPNVNIQASVSLVGNSSHASSARINVFDSKRNVFDNDQLLVPYKYAGDSQIFPNLMEQGLINPNDIQPQTLFSSDLSQIPKSDQRRSQDQVVSPHTPSSAFGDLSLRSPPDKFGSGRDSVSPRP